MMVNRAVTWISLVAVLAGCSGGGGARATHRPPPPAEPQRIAIVVTVDGLMPEAYTEPDKHGLAVPTLRMLARQGAWASSARPVMPTVTYPSHTTIATGVEPARHGIVSNRAFDPLEKNQGGWRWYAEDIRATTLWQVAERSGKQVALLQWPVTAGARARWLVPEYWRASTSEDQKLLRALATPGLLQGVVRRFPDFWQRPDPSAELLDDRRVVDIAVHLLDVGPPDLIMMHLVVVDHFEHERGAWSKEALAATEYMDVQLGRLVQECKRRGLWSRVGLFVVSDHGFAASHTELRPAVLFREAQLIEVDAAGKPKAWKAGIQANGGSAYVYLARPGDATTGRAVRALLEPHVGPGKPIKRMVGPAEIAAIGGDPEAFLALDAADGYVFQEGTSGAWLKTPSGARGHHGWFPDNTAMRASFIAHGPGIRPGALGEVRLLDVAPTVARWLGVPLPDATGKPIDLATAPTSSQ
jgi:predicted AlkP superfamily pyrophosphatase or phosphodiesterase